MMCGCDCPIRKRVFETGFALDDILLYLDTHPMDREALRYYQYAKQQNEEAVRAYEQTYGPLMFTQVDCKNEWSWMKNPWPWEGGAN